MNEWIIMRTALKQDVRVLQIARNLKIHRMQAIGHLWAFWAWMDRITEDGQNLPITRKEIDVEVERPGFADCLMSVGWLTGTDGRLNIPRFEKWNIESTKKRSSRNQRQARWRAGQASTKASTKAST